MRCRLSAADADSSTESGRTPSRRFDMVSTTCCAPQSLAKLAGRASHPWLARSPGRSASGASSEFGSPFSASRSVRPLSAAPRRPKLPTIGDACGLGVCMGAALGDGLRQRSPSSMRAMHRITGAVSRRASALSRLSPRCEEGIRGGISEYAAGSRPRPIPRFAARRALQR